MTNKFFYIVAVAVSLAGCSADDLIDWKERPGGPGINFGASAPASDNVSRGVAASSSQSIILKSDISADTLTVYVESSPGFIGGRAVSRGAPTTADGFSAFSVSAFYYRGGESVAAPSLFFKENVTKQTDGAWATGTIYYWPTAEGSQLAFLGVSPSDIAADSSYGVELDAVSESDFSLTYTAPAEAENQPDLMVAVAPMQNGHNQPGYKVPMQFSHILSQVSFVVGAEMPNGTINSITLDGVASSGTYNDGSWTLTDGAVSSYTVAVDASVSASTAPGTGINKVEQTLMMIPQTLSADGKLTVAFTKEGDAEPTVLTASLAGAAWDMGGSTVYRINIKSDYTLEFAESGIPALDAHYEKFEINVNSDKLPEGWTLTSNYPNDVFFTSELSEMQMEGYWIDNKKGESTVSGTGNRHFYVYVTENALDADGNLTNADRNIELILTPNGVDNPQDVRLAVTQYCPALSADGLLGAERILDPGKYPWGFKFDNVKVTYTYPSATGILGGFLLEVYRWLLFDSEFIRRWLGIESLPDYVVKGSGTTICTFNLDSIEFNEAQSVDDGRKNSWNLYNYDGYSAVNALDSYFGSNENIVRKITPEGTSFDIISNYAAFMVLKNCNKFTEMSEQQGDAALTVAVLAQEDCLWYLPASGQYPKISDVAGLTEGTKYWTSTSDAGYDDAYTFTAHSTVNPPESRMNDYNVVAVRSK